METLLIGLAALVAAVVILRLIAIVSKIVIVVGFAAVLVGVWFYPAEAYAVVRVLRHEAVNLFWMVG